MRYRIDIMSVLYFFRAVEAIAVFGFEYNIYRLSDKFRHDYPPAAYPELLEKSGRAYACLLIDTHQGYYICVPYRSNIKHKNAFIFKGTNRSHKGHSGLDYSKIVIIADSDYIDFATEAVIDSDEYSKTKRLINIIASGAVAYVEHYVRHINGEEPLSSKDYNRIYGKSTLPYFDELLLSF